MSYCPECGEQIAKEDVFCPYCGISIKPIAPVEDSSMSATIVDMPPVIINKEALDALTAKNAQEPPKNETQTEPVSEKQAPVSEKPETSEPLAKPENALGYSAGSTSENWGMKTESVEIPAEQLEDVKSIPLPSPFGEDEPAPAPETAPESVELQEPQTSVSEETNISEPLENLDEPENISEVPAPQIIQNQEFELIKPEEPVQEVKSSEESIQEIEAKTEEPVSETEEPSFETPPPFTEPEGSNEINENADFAPIVVEPEISEPQIVEPPTFEPFVSESTAEPVAEFSEETPKPLIDEEVVEAVSESSDKTENIETVSEPFEKTGEEAEEKNVDSGFIEPEISSGWSELKPTTEISQPFAEEKDETPVAEPQPIFEEPKPFAENAFEAPIDAETPIETIEAAPIEEKIEEETSAPVAEFSVETEEPKTSEPESPSEVFEPPIGMPELPLILGNQDESTKFDSVQNLQKNETEAEKVEAAPVETEIPAPVVEEKPVVEPSVAESSGESKEGRSFTTPNIGNTDTDGRKAAKLKPLDEGTILNNRYEIVRKIGGGGMGAVYLANDRNLGGVLRAVKEMVQSYIESEQQDKAVSDLKRESLLLTSLDHTSIPTIYDYFFDEKEGRFYLVMKYISGGDLAGRLRAAPEGRIDEKSVTEWAIQIADVLYYLHTHEPSIVYRDLKPANVMIDGNSGRVMLIDFGIARWVNKEEKGVTAVGTMGYAPPELFSGNVEPRSDIYSLGSTMFHLLTGADPQSNPLLIFDFQKNPRPRQINSQLSDQIELILMRSVEYSADARFASAAEFRDALKDHLNNLQMGKVTYGVKAAPSSRAFAEQAVFCGFCGKQIVATDVFCAFCGAQQPIAQQGVSSPSLAVQPLTAKLVIQGTNELEPTSFKLDKTENLLGRRDPMSNIFPEVDLSRYDPQTKISRRHARIWREGNSFLVEDLGSSNGTTLLPSSSDSIRLLPHQPHTLTNGDKVRLGDTTLHFTIG